MHWAEIAAVICGVLYVILAARESILCWPFGILNALFSIYLFYLTKLYAESALYFYYVLAGIYGWYAWRYDRRGGDALHVIEWGWKRHVALIGLGLGLSWLLGWGLQAFTDARMPLVDAHTTIFSFLATYLVTRKVLSNWLYWIVIDAVSVWLYAVRELNLYAFLMFGYTAMAVYGYMAWRKKRGLKP